MILSRMEHKNVIKLHEVYQDEANFYLVLDYVNGLTLRQDFKSYKNETYSLDRALKIFK
jgi:serine/threonine protein kinase